MKFFKTGRVLPTLLLICILLLGVSTIAYYDVLCLAPYQTVYAGESLAMPQTKTLSSLLPQVSVEQKRQLSPVAEASASQPAVTEQDALGAYQLELKAGGLLPLKAVSVEELAPRQVLAGGHSIGILLQTEGVTVVGHSAVTTSAGTTIYPAKEAGLKAGDFITTINDNSINSNAQIRDLIDELGKNNNDCQIHYIREGLEFDAQVKPLYCADSKSYRIGLYVRDNTAGVGTLTFYDPQSGEYGALGHMVSGLDHGVKDEDKGSIVRAAIQGVKSGVKGAPGEKLGVFIGSDWQGSIEINGEFGIFGQLNQAISNAFYPQPLAVALPQQVETGPAQIFTVIEGEDIEAFDIEIVKTMPNYKSSGKGMVIKITDPRLLEATGGIVQGMSGSPIIQNGRLAGAVTHVFINDPQRGYACFAQWMMEEAGIW